MKLSLAHLLPFAILASSACTPGEREGARTAIDVVQATCIALNSALPDNEIARICHVTTPFLGPMRELLAGSREASARAVSAAHQAGACGGAPDGGAR